MSNVVAYFRCPACAVLCDVVDTAPEGYVPMCPPMSSCERAGEPMEEVDRDTFLDEAGAATA